MKLRHIFLSIALTGCISAFSQSDKHTIIQKTVTKQVNNGRTMLRTDTEYDGLGRPVKTTTFNATPLHQNLVDFTVYDCMGRSDSIEYLPYPSGLALYPEQEGKPLRPLAASPTDPFAKSPQLEQREYYTSKYPTDGRYAYTRRVYDKSGLNLCAASYAPGADFSKESSAGNRPTIYSQRLNIVMDTIKRFSVVGSSLVPGGYYAPGMLHVQTTTSSDNSSVSEYTDPAGQLLVREIKTSSGQLERNYYVYDDFGRQRFIIPAIQERMLPTSGQSWTWEDLCLYCYYYEYDSYGQITLQTVPGADYTINLYDQRNRLALSQDGNQRNVADSLVSWSFIKYDALDRPVLSGIIRGGTYDEHKTELEKSTVLYEVRQVTNGIHGYSNDCYPKVESPDVLTATYYDSYNWNLAHFIVSNYKYKYENVLGETQIPVANGLVTGTRRKVLGIDTNKWLESIYYYNDKYQTIESVAELYPTGIEYVHNKYDFTGNVEHVRVRQNLAPRKSEVVVGPGIGSDLQSKGDIVVRPGGIIGELDIPQNYGYDKLFRYDDWGRILDERHIILGNSADTVTIASYDYDTMGRLKSENLHDKSYQTTFELNMQGATTGASSPDFSYHLGFNRDTLGGKPRFDGNINYVSWQRPSQPGHAYAFAYTPKGQLKAANHYEAVAGEWQGTNTCAERNISYDLNGNILTMERTNGEGEVSDNLSYVYSGNMLMKHNFNNIFQPKTVIMRVYRYDANGNMTYDPYDDYHIDYNPLNLPARIFDDSNEIRYIYSSDGQKLASVVNGSFTYYRATMVYNKAADSQNEQLLYMLHEKGIATKENNAWMYKYTLKDHLGSTRSLLAAHASEMVEEQTTDYYPFGLAWSYNDLHRNRRLYIGKELQDAMVGNRGLLGMYDFGARYYNPRLGRWFNIDPALQLMNPYIYCGNSPMMFVDKDGEWAWLIALLMGGIFNTVVNADNIGSFGQFCTYFGIGAVSGLAMSKVPVLGAYTLGFGNNAVTQGFKNGWSNIHWGNAMLGGAITGTTYLFGGALNKAISRPVSQLFNWVGNSSVRAGLTQGVSTSVSGFGVGTSVALMTGSDWDEALKTGGISAAQGTMMGFINGFSSAYKYSKEQRRLSANEIVSTKDLGLNNTMERIQNREKYPHHNDGSIFKNKEAILPQQPLGYYREYVHPTNGQVGSQRVVIGNNGDIWYTPDHYKTFLNVIIEY